MLLTPTVTLLNQGAVWSPLRLPGLAAWYDASDSATVLTSVGPDVPATDGQTVRRWLDKSGNARHLDQTVLANQPMLSGGFVVANNSAMQTASFSVSQPFTLYFSGDWIAELGAGPTMFELSPESTLQVFRRQSNGLFEVRTVPNSANPFSPATEPFGATAVNGIVYSGATSLAKRNIAAGVAMDLSTDGITTGLLMFSRSGSILPVHGRMRDFLLYSGAHTEEQMNQVARWMATRAGVTV